MTKRTIADIVRQWRMPTKNLGNRFSRAENISLTKNKPTSLEAKIATSPYARILASPLRTCNFYARQFPSKLLLRFGQGWHSPTKCFWAVPTFKKSKGKGVYIILSKKILELFGKGGYKSAFRGSAVYRIDMLSHVESLLCEETFLQFSKRPMNTFHVLKQSKNLEWVSDVSCTTGYQCILSFEASDSVCELGHTIQSIDTQFHDIPCYHVQHIWTKEQLESLQIKDPIVLGIPKTLETVDLSISLWRCREFLC